MNFCHKLVEELARLVYPVTRGDPESPLRWTCKSAATLALELTTVVTSVIEPGRLPPC